MNNKSANSTSVSTLLAILIQGPDNSGALRSSSMKVYLRFRRLRFRSMITLMLAVTFSMSLLFGLLPFEAQASGGSYTLKWYAADPSANGVPYLPTYEKMMPDSLPSPGDAGRYADPLANAVAYSPISNSLDAVTSLAPKDLALGQIVPYEMVIKVSGSTAPESGTIKFTTSFDTNTTSGDNFGFDPSYMIYAAFVDTADAGTIDPGNNAKVNNFTSTLTGSGSSQQIQGTFYVSGLDDGDRVVVEIWVVLKSNISTSPSGNVQTGLFSAQTSSGSKINTGEQTVPLLRVKEFFTNKADISVAKTDSPDPVIQGQNIIYSLVVKNNSPDTYANGVNITDTLDSNISFISAIGAPYIINGNNITFNLGALKPDQSEIISIVARVSDTAPAITDLSIDPEPGTQVTPTFYDVINKVSVTAITSDPNIDNNAYYQPTNVLLALPVYFIDKKVTDVGGKGPLGEVTAVGDIIEYQINVSNAGNVDLTNVILNDSMINLTGPTGDNDDPGILNVGETWTYTGNYTVTQADINSNGGGDVIINNTATVDCDQLVPKSRTVEVPIRAKPACIINKIVTDIAGNGPTGEIANSGDVISYEINVSNIGNVDLTNVTVNDSLINLTEPTGDNMPIGILNVGETWTYTGNYTVTQEDISSNGGGNGIINNIVTVDCDQLEPKSQTAEVPVKAKPAYIINKIITDVAGNGPSGVVESAGNVISYQINVNNVGNINLTSTTLNDSLINLLTGPAESLNTNGILELGEVWTYTGNYTVNQTDIDSNGGGNGLIENTATVDCDQLDPKSQTVEVPVTADPAYIINKVVKDVAGNGPAGSVTSAGDLIRYQVNVDNVGSVSLTNVTLNDSLINLTGPVESLNTNGILEPGEVWTYTGDYTVNQTDIDSDGGGNGLIENTATVDCDQLESKSQTAEVPVTADPAYIINKVVKDVAGNGPAGNVTSAGDLIRYQVNVDNVGSVSLTNVTLNDSLTNLTGPEESLNTNGILEPGEVWTYIGNYTVNQTDISSNGGGDGLIENTATVDCDQLDPKFHVAEVPLQGSTAYILDKKVTDIVGEGPSGYVTSAGDLIGYQVNVSNVGSFNLTNVTLNDTLINLTGPEESLNTNGILEPGEVWTYTGNYTVNQTDINGNGGGDGLIENTATVDCDQLGPKSHTAEVPVTADPAYILDKKATGIVGAGSSGYITTAGNLISYRINLTNVGNIALTNVTLHDSLVDLTGPVESLSTNGFLEPGEVWTYTGNYTVNQTDIDSNGGGNGLIENTATVDCDQLDPKSYTAEVPIQGSAAYIIDKKVTEIVGNGLAGFVTASGDLIGYQINVSNVGSVNLTNLTLNDSLITPINLIGPEESLNINGVLEPGEIWTYNGSYTVNQTDIDSNGGGDGLIENTATVDCDQLDPKSYTEEVPIKTPAYIINKIITNVAGKGPSGYVTSAGDTISYQVNVSNVGDVNLTNVTLNDSLINLVGPSESLNTDEILEPGETWIYAGNYTVTQANINYNGTVDGDSDEINGPDGDIDNTATVDCDQLCPKSQTAEVPVKAEPAYIIHKIVTDVAGRGPSGYVTSVGDVISYRINVTNVGNVELTNVTLSSRINLTGFTESLNTNGILEPGEIWTYIGNYTVTQADINYNGTASDDYDDRYGPDGDIDSYATVDCDQLNPKTRNVEVQFGRPVYMIDKIVTDVAGAGPAGHVTKTGDIISYQINVSNIGNLDLTNVTVNDSLISLADKTGDNDPVGILDLGETWVYAGNYTVTQDDLNNISEGIGFINNTATVDSSLLAPEMDSITVPIVLLPAYTIDKSVLDVANKGPEGSITTAGDVITYQINVTNIGQVNLTNITLNDSLANLTGPTESLDADSILEIGESWIYNITYTVTQADINSRGIEEDDIDDIGSKDEDIDNIATVDCDQLATSTHTVDIPIERNPQYSIFKSIINPDASGDCIINSPGDEIPYRIVVKNEGNTDLTNITINDTLIDLTGPIGNDTEKGILQPGEIWIYTGIYTLKSSDINNGTGYINNTATVTCDDLPEKNSSVSQPIDMNTGLSIYKSVTKIDEAGDHIINDAGDIIQYQVAVKNNGNIDLTGVSVSDPMVNLIKTTGDSVDLGVLNPGETWVYIGNYSVTQEDINSAKEGFGIIENTAIVSCNQLSNKSSSLELPIIYVPSTVITSEPENPKVLPVPDFTTNVTSGYAPLSIQFTDQSQNAVSRSWDFNNDGNEDSSDINPVYTYTTPGTYAAKLTVSNANITDSKTATITVLHETTSNGGESSDESSGSSGDGDSFGKAYVVSNNASGSNESTGKDAVVSPSEGLTESSGNSNRTTGANVEQTAKQQSSTTPVKETKKTPGFDSILGITALLVVFLYKRE